MVFFIRQSGNWSVDYAVTFFLRQDSCKTGAQEVLFRQFQG